MGKSMGNEMEPSTGIAMGNQMELNIDNNMGFSMGNHMGLAMGLNMGRASSTLPAIDLSHAHQATGLHRAPTNMRCISWCG